MATNFPTSLDTFTDPTGTDYLNSPDHAGQHTDKNDAVEALEAKVGVDNSAVTTSLDYKVNKYKKLEKTTDETRNNNTTTADDTDLKFDVAANTKYRFRMQLFFYTTAAADFKYQFTGPGTPTVLAIRREATVAGQQTVSNALDVAYLTTDVTLVGNASGVGQIRFYGILHNGATAGTVAFRWAQNTSNAGPTTVYAGSFIEYNVV